MHGPFGNVLHLVDYPLVTSLGGKIKNKKKIKDVFSSGYIHVQLVSLVLTVSVLER